MKYQMQCARPQCATLFLFHLGDLFDHGGLLGDSDKAVVVCPICGLPNLAAIEQNDYQYIHRSHKDWLFWKWMGLSDRVAGDPDGAIEIRVSARPLDSRRLMLKGKFERGSAGGELLWDLLAGISPRVAAELADAVICSARSARFSGWQGVAFCQQLIWNAGLRTYVQASGSAFPDWILTTEAFTCLAVSSDHWQGINDCAGWLQDATGISLEFMSWEMTTLEHKFLFGVIGEAALTTLCQRYMNMSCGQIALCSVCGALTPFALSKYGYSGKAGWHYHRCTNAEYWFCPAHSLDARHCTRCG